MVLVLLVLVLLLLLLFFFDRVNLSEYLDKHDV